MIFSPGLGLELGWVVVVGFLIPLLGAAAKFLPTVLPAIGKIFGGGMAPKVAPSIVRALPSVTGAITRIARPALPAIRRALPTLRKGVGIAGAGAAFEAGTRVIGGPRGIQVRIGRNGEMEAVPRRRRINPGNVRAARRAIRRLRAFARVTRKVNRLLSPRKVFVRASRFRRRSRGDILPFEHDGSINPYAAEDWADYADEMEDLGYDPGSFFQGDDEEVAE